MLKTLYSKLLALLVLSTLIPASTIGMYGIFSSTQAISELNLNRIKKQTNDRVRNIESFLSHTQKNLQFLVTTPPFQGVIRAREGGGVDRETSNLKTSRTIALSLRSGERNGICDRNSPSAITLKCQVK
ncbi:hypothetical protein LAY57_08275 [Argonema antarcticum A004/B2]|nr:hypothetical protein [Argonema antarcticum A004/B2]